MALNTADASGVQLSEVILERFADLILYEALGAMRFVQFATERTDLMKNPGEVLKFLKFDDLSGDPALTNESTAITTDGVTADEISVTVSEFGRAVSVSEKLLVVSFVDVLKEQAKILGRHYGQFGPDKSLRDVALDNAGTNSVSVVFGGAQTARTAVTANDVMTTDVIRDAVEQLQTANAPKFNNDFYVCVAHPHQLRYLRQDPDWIAANNAHETRNAFMGEVGRWEDVIFLSTTNLPNGTGTAGTLQFLDIGSNGVNDLSTAAGNLTNIYQASLFGEAFYALAWALPVELRDDGVEDFGRVHKLAWYAIYGCNVLHPTYGVRIETA